ncbi:chemotaxis protein CheW [Caldalkalibacillus salinus]|uniref:chemotaxis protein CheW n=1 Tax=Caldalkalibacillus salinus TaxID=2803787 RepID=UPI001922FFC0|nr:chemotaxis protein CheW [Caldalkalibacillus salinus]
MAEQQLQVEDTKVIVFRLKDEEYGVEVGQIKSIERMQHITIVPNTPDFVRGVINLRGVVTPVINLRTRFELGEEEELESTRIIIVTVDDIEVGLIVDAAHDVIDVPASAVEPPPEVIGGIEADYLRGVAKVGKRLLILLNLDRVLSPEEVELVKQIEA